MAKITSMTVNDQKLIILLGEYADAIKNDLDTSKIKDEIDKLQWITDYKPPDFKNVLATIEGYKEACIAGRWGEEWFLINVFDQKYEGSEAAVKVTAWRELPKTYEP